MKAKFAEQRAEEKLAKVREFVAYANDLPTETVETGEEDPRVPYVWEAHPTELALGPQIDDGQDLAIEVDDFHALYYSDRERRWSLICEGEVRWPVECSQCGHDESDADVFRALRVAGYGDEHVCADCETD